MTVGPGAAKIRPYVVCAILRGVSFNSKTYKSFMDLQARLSFTMDSRGYHIASSAYHLFMTSSSVNTDVGT